MLAASRVVSHAAGIPTHTAEELSGAAPGRRTAPRRGLRGYSPHACLSAVSTARHTHTLWPLRPHIAVTVQTDPGPPATDTPHSGGALLGSSDVVSVLGWVVSTFPCRSGCRAWLTKLWLSTATIELWSNRLTGRSTQTRPVVYPCVQFC